ncbi:MAG: bifunctional serine/threonine-protein kinase/formylglycine-generating enzyme family protein [Candidatus Acidiferrales bacterium]
MTSERLQEINKVLAAALERRPEERSAYLDDACRDPDVRRQVEVLIAARDRDEHLETQSLSAAETLSGGTRVGPYEVLAPLGAGGMGVVYRARDLRLEREVAIKFLPIHFLVDQAARSRFRQEALALAKVNHPNIASVYDIGEANGADYLVMEYIPGESLAQKLKSGALPVAEAMSVASQVAAALEEAHERGIVHRDLKPANIIVTPKGHVKVLDFGLAKLLSVAETENTPTFSKSSGIVGTPLYMSPEQAEGRPVDSRTDLWSLGVVLYESIGGQPPFDGTALTVLRAISQEKPKPLRELRADIPPEAEQIVSRALQKDAVKRYQSAAEMERDLSSASTRLSAPAAAVGQSGVKVPFGLAIAGAILLIAVLVSAAWLYHRSNERVWARDQAIPEIAKLQNQRKALAAFLVLKRAQEILPRDARLAQLAADSTGLVSVASSPSGASVEIRDYLAPTSAWYRLGTTPLNNIQIPNGYFQWHVSKQGLGEYVAAPLTAPRMNFALDKQVSAPAGMSWVSGGTWANFIVFVGLVGPDQLPAFYIDRYEVTNSQYQQFVDAGGYQNRKYWTNDFVRDGKEIEWDAAMALFRDGTGRPGPSTWEGGHYPEGQGNYPVSGVSWYEAAACAAFANKSLPAFAQWYDAASPEQTHYIVQNSDISLSKPAPVGQFQGLGIYGTYDMAGNVREWVLNDTGEGTKFILGGSWRSQTYLSIDPQALSPFDRSPENGFRCVRNTAPLPPEMLRPVRKFERDFSTYKPAPDDVFRAYLALYAYDKTPLHAEVEGIVGETDDWREEKVTYDTAYNNERMAAYLFLPKHVRPPYQTVVFSPSARVLDLHDSRKLGDTKFFDYIVQSGRAVLYPVFYGTYERQGTSVYVGAAQQLTYLANKSKDLGRSLDYLATRRDIDTNKVAYLGVSMGSAEGVIYTAIAQDRLKTVIFLDGGYFLGQPPRGGDQADFAPRLKLPVLMVNGRYDYVFSLEQSQDPLFRMLGAPDAEKEHVVFDTPHDVTERRSELIQVVLGWLDKYLGRVD